MRKRMLDPEFWIDEEIASLPYETRLLYQGLWGLCDDHHATFPNRPKWIKAQIFPYDDIAVEKSLDALAKIGKIVLFESQEDSKQYYYLTNFFKHQNVKKPSKVKYPAFIHNLSTGITSSEKSGTSTEKVGTSGELGVNGDITTQNKEKVKENANLSTVPKKAELVPKKSELGSPEEKRSKEKRREGKRSQEKVIHTLAFLQNVENDKNFMDEILTEIIASRDDVVKKAESLYLHCLSKNKTYFDYRALLRKVCHEDFPKRTKEDQKNMQSLRKRAEKTRQNLTRKFKIK